MIDQEGFELLQTEIEDLDDLEVVFDEKKGRVGIDVIDPLRGGFTTYFYSLPEALFFVNGFRAAAILYNQEGDL